MISVGLREPSLYSSRVAVCSMLVSKVSRWLEREWKFIKFIAGGAIIGCTVCDVAFTPLYVIGDSMQVRPLCVCVATGKILHLQICTSPRQCQVTENRSNETFGPKGQVTSLPPSPSTRGWGWHISRGWLVSGGLWVYSFVPCSLDPCNS